MGRRLATAGAACLAGLALAAAGVRAAAPTATKWVDAQFDYSIVLPIDWYIIPRTTAGIAQAAATYARQKQASLARAYDSLLTSPESVHELSVYRFQAFVWPPLDSLVPTELSLQIVSDRRYITADLPAAGAAYAQALSGSGSSIAGPTAQRLPAGACEVIRGTVANGGGVRTGLELYIFTHGGRLYVLSFKLGAGFLREAAITSVLREIAAHFSFGA